MKNGHPGTECVMYKAFGTIYIVTDNKKDKQNKPRRKSIKIK